VSIPKFEFHLKDAADRNTARRFIEACVRTGKFARNEKGQVCWSPGAADWIPIARASELRTVLEDANVLEVTGDVDNSDSYFAMWTWLADQRWKLPKKGVAFNPYEALSQFFGWSEAGSRETSKEAEAIAARVRGAELYYCVRRNHWIVYAPPVVRR